jgi:YegS/Rv2252/BmrU family lipid kinase
MSTGFDISSRWAAIVNPVAGSGRGLTDWPQISGLLRDEGIAVDAMFTLHKYHATELAVTAVRQGYRRIIVVGGDGTIHETVNGFFIQRECPTTDILMAVIAVGTGNDWIRMFGIPRNYVDAIRSIRQGHAFLQDVGRVSYYESKVHQTRYLANVAGVGYDAAVCRGFNRLKEKGYRGNWIYLFNVFREAVRYRTRRVRIEVDGEEVFAGKLFTGTIGICKYTAGGLTQTPNAIPDDGLFDLTVIPAMNRVRLFSRFRTVYTGNIYDIPRISLFRGGSIRIHAEQPIRLEIDGEILGYSDFEFKILERAIRVVVSEKFIQDHI